MKGEIEAGDIIQLRSLKGQWLFGVKSHLQSVEHCSHFVRVKVGRKLTVYQSRARPGPGLNQVQVKRKMQCFACCQRS